MTWREWAIRNLRYHWQDLMAYFLSCTWAVTLVHLFMQVIDHPELASDVHRGFFFVALFLLVFFMAGFIWLSHQYFYRKREEEWELLSWLGMESAHWKRLLLWESGLLAGISILGGLGGGFLLAPLFYLAVSTVLFLPDPLGMHFSWRGILWTVAFFALLYFIVTWRIWNQLGNEQLRSTKLPRLQLSEKWGIVFSLLSLGGVWWGTDTATWTAWIPRFPFIVFLGLFGGFGLLRYGGAWLMSWARNQPLILKIPSLWLLITWLRPRWSQDARLLILISGMMTIAVGMGSFCFVFWNQADHLAVEQNPWTIQIVGVKGNEIAKEVERVLAEEGLPIEQKMSLPMLKANKRETSYILVSSSDFNELLKSRGYPPFQIDSGEAIDVFPFQKGAKEEKHRASTTLKVERWTLQVGAGSWKVDVVQRSNLRLLNQHPLTEHVLVLAVSDFQKLWEQSSEEQFWIYGWRSSRWRESSDVLERLEDTLQDKNNLAKTPLRESRWLRQGFAPLMFFSLFLGILFFLASVTLITFRLRQQVIREPERWQRLGEWGMTAKKRMEMIHWEVRVIFALPWLLTLGAAVLVNRFLDVLVPGGTATTVATVYVVQAGMWCLVYRFMWEKFCWWLEERIEEI